MKKESIYSPNWQTPRVVKAGGFVFVSGTTSKTPERTVLAPDDIVAQTHIIIKRIESDLIQAGTSLKNVVKVTVFINDSSKWPEFNQAFLEHFKEDRPARTTIQAGGFSPGQCIEMDAIAIIPDE